MRLNLLLDLYRSLWTGLINSYYIVHFFFSLCLVHCSSWFSPSTYVSVVAFVSDVVLSLFSLRKCSCLPCSSASASGLCLCCPPCWPQALLSLAQPVSDFRHFCSGQDLFSVFWCIKYLFPVSFLSFIIDIMHRGKLHTVRWGSSKGMILPYLPFELFSLGHLYNSVFISWEMTAASGSSLSSFIRRKGAGRRAFTWLGSLHCFSGLKLWYFSRVFWNLKSNQKIAFCLCLYIS